MVGLPEKPTRALGKAGSIGAVRSHDRPDVPGHSRAEGQRGVDRVFDRTGVHQTGPYARIEPKGQDTHPPRGEYAADGPVSCATRAAPSRDARTRGNSTLNFPAAVFRINGWTAFLIAGVVAGGLAFATPRVQAAEASNNRLVTVAAAADLKFALEAVNRAFTNAHPEIAVRVTYGSSGNFFTQLSNKAPFDLFLSADLEYPRKLAEQGVARKDSLFQYAVGRIVVWVPKDSKLDLDKLGMRALLDPSVRKIAIANPKHAPYGQAAEAAMRKLDVYDQAKDKLVFGENVVQTAQYVESGAADIGIIALSLAKAPAMSEKGRYWEVPLAAYPRMDQGGVILSGASDVPAATALRDFLVSDKGREILAKYGFFVAK